MRSSFVPFVLDFFACAMLTRIFDYVIDVLSSFFFLPLLNPLSPLKTETSQLVVCACNSLEEDVKTAEVGHNWQ